MGLEAQALESGGGGGPGRLIIGKHVAVATWVGLGWFGLVCGSTVLIYLFGLGFLGSLGFGF